MIGDCPVCGRQNVPLRTYYNVNTHADAQACADQHACLAAWAAGPEGQALERRRRARATS